MKARQWIEIAAVASATALCSAAIANDLDRTPGGDDASVSSAVHQALAERNDTRGSAAALPQDAATNAAMNRAAELGTSVPGAPIASNEEGVDARTASNRDDTHATTNDEGTAPRGSSATSLSGSATLSDEGAASTGATNDEGPASTRAPTNDESAAPADAATSDEPATRATTSDERAASANAATSDEPSTGATTESTMNDRSGTSVSGTASGSSSFDAWANDYAARHDGHITRQQFLDEMGSRFDRLDSRHQGYLTPYEVEEVFIFTPADTTHAAGEAGLANTQ